MLLGGKIAHTAAAMRTALVGLPTLRLVRAAIGDWKVTDILPGEYRIETVDMPEAKKSGFTGHAKKRALSKRAPNKTAPNKTAIAKTPSPKRRS